MALIDAATDWLAGDRREPLVNFNFMLTVELVFDVPLKSVRAFTRENEFDQIREGGLNDYVHLKRKGISKPFTFQVERYVGQETTDYLALGTELTLPVFLQVYRTQRAKNWDSNDASFDEEITAKAARYYVFTGCTVMAKEYGELSADRSGLLTETVTIAYNEMFVLDLGAEPDAAISFSKLKEKAPADRAKEVKKNYSTYQNNISLKDSDTKAIDNRFDFSNYVGNKDGYEIRHANTSTWNSYGKQMTAAEAETEASGNTFGFSAYSKDKAGYVKKNTLRGNTSKAKSFGKQKKAEEAITDAQANTFVMKDYDKDKAHYKISHANTSGAKSFGTQRSAKDSDDLAKKNTPVIGKSDTYKAVRNKKHKPLSEAEQEAIDTKFGFREYTQNKTGYNAEKLHANSLDYSYGTQRTAEASAQYAELNTPVIGESGTYKAVRNEQYQSAQDANSEALGNRFSMNEYSKNKSGYETLHANTFEASSFGTQRSAKESEDLAKKNTPVIGDEGTYKANRIEPTQTALEAEEKAKKNRFEFSEYEKDHDGYDNLHANTHDAGSFGIQRNVMESNEYAGKNRFDIKNPEASKSAISSANDVTKPEFRKWPETRSAVDVAKFLGKSNR